jgi:hypothetical protein
MSDHVPSSLRVPNVTNVYPSGEERAPESKSKTYPKSHVPQHRSHGTQAQTAGPSGRSVGEDGVVGERHRGGEVPPLGERNDMVDTPERLDGVKV